MEIGQQIKHYREKKGYSQKELAGLVHMSERTVGHYETGTRSPSVEALTLLAKALDIDITSFFIPHSPIDDTLTSASSAHEKLMAIPFKDVEDIGVVKKEEEIHDAKKHMDGEIFKDFMKRSYQENDIEIKIMEDEQYIQVYNVTEGVFEEIFDKQFAKYMISLVDEQTIIEIIYFKKNDYFTIIGDYHGNHFNIGAHSCEEHGFDFRMYACERFFYHMSSTIHIPPIIHEIWHWFLETFQPKHVHRDFFSHAYFSDFSLSHILSYRMYRCDKFPLSDRSYNCLEKRNLLTIESILSLTEEDIKGFHEIGYRGTKEILYVQEDIQKWIEKFAKQ